MAWSLPRPRHLMCCRCCFLALSVLLPCPCCRPVDGGTEHCHPLLRFFLAVRTPINPSLRPLSCSSPTPFPTTPPPLSPRLAPELTFTNACHQACWTLSNIAAGTVEQIQTVLDSGALPSLVELASSQCLDPSGKSGGGGGHRCRCFCCSCSLVCFCSLVWLHRAAARQYQHGHQRTRRKSPRAPVVSCLLLFCDAAVTGT